jgi:hypothetical protein
MRDADQQERLWYRLREEMFRQLDAVNSEDPELFLESVRISQEIIDSLSQMQLEVGQSDALIQEITAIREQISARMPALQDKLRRQVESHRQQTTIRQHYYQEHYHVPSIFFDKRN